MLGSNVSAVGGIIKAFDQGDLWKCKSIQIYITPSRTWKMNQLTEEYVLAFKDRWNESDVEEVVAHIPFLVNLASPDEQLRNRSIDRLKQEIVRAEELGVRYLVLHPGSRKKLSLEAGVAKIADGLNQVLSDFDGLDQIIALETMSGQGTTLGGRFEELAQILSLVEKREMCGVCFDTAHVFQAGYDLNGEEGYQEVFTHFDEMIGLDQLKVFHLNNSKTKLGSKRDLHEEMDLGEIVPAFFAQLLKDPRFIDIPKILEIPDRDNRSKDNLDFLRRL